MEDPFDLDLFGNEPNDRMSDEEVTTKLCPRCWRTTEKNAQGYDWCPRCKAALVYLKPRPYDQRNDP